MVRLLGRRPQASTGSTSSRLTSVHEQEPTNPGKSVEGERDISVAVTEDSTMTEQEKRELFMLKLREISTKYVEETPEDRRAILLRSTDRSLDFSQVASRVPLKHNRAGVTSSPERSRGPQQAAQSSPIASLANVLGIASCTDFFCLMSSPSTTPERPPRQTKKSGGRRVEQVMIPKEIDLSPVRVSSLDEEDSLARHMRFLAELDETDDKYRLMPLSERAISLVSKLTEPEHAAFAKENMPGNANTYQVQKEQSKVSDVFDDLLTEPHMNTAQ